MPQQTPTAQSSLRLTLLLSLGLVVAACGGGSDAPASGRSASTTSTTAAEAEALSPDEQLITDAYLDFWAFRVEVLDPPNPDDPRIPDFMAAEALTEFVALLRDRQASGIGTRLAEPSGYRQVILSIEIAGDTAKVRSCQVDDLVVYDLATDAVINDDESVVIVDSEMTFEQGRWKMTTIDTSAGIESVGSCPVSNQ